MSLHFSYRLTNLAKPVYSLGGRTVRPRPLVDLTIIGPTDSRVLRALLDTGADDTILPEAFAALIGIDLSTAPVGSQHNPGLGAIAVRYATVKLRLTDGVEFREWPAIVGFTPARLVYPALGFAGVLQFFTATFRGETEEVELTVNGLYPGT